MKKIISILVLSTILLASCTSDNFYETKRYFKTDKNEYVLGDTILLTAIIRPIKETKTIRVYENYKNIEISFALMNSQIDLHNSEWTARTGQSLPESKVNEFTITKEEPLTKQYKIGISEENDSIFLTIPEVNYKVSFDKNLVIHPNTSVRIHGFCNPISPEFGASLEEYFEVKDIRIRKKTHHNT